jgi:hypothetical protein
MELPLINVLNIKIKTLYVCFSAIVTQTNMKDTIANQVL